MKHILVIFFLLLQQSSFAQPPANHAIRVNIISDKEVPVQDATVSLLNASDSTLVKTSLSNSGGLAELENLKDGKYILLISHVNFEKKFINPVQLNETLNIRLQPRDGTLTGVVVETKKPFIERRIDRLIVNVENSIVGAGSSAF
jgi:hypothetical protein